jgi:hypothetical protein
MLELSEGRPRMKTKKKQASCVQCGTEDGLYVTIEFADGVKKFPSYTLVIGKGIFCNKCKEENK